MQTTLTMPYGMKMEMAIPEKKVSDFIQMVFQYGFGQEPGTALPAARKLEPDPPAAQEPPRRKMSRVERMFGDFKASRAAESKEPEQQNRPEGYYGFLLVKCEQCGKVRGFHAKKITDKYSCECGGVTELRDLKPLHLRCKCGSKFTYRTNMDEEFFDYPCLSCGNPVDLELNKRGDTYVTMAASDA